MLTALSLIAFGSARTSTDNRSARVSFKTVDGAKCSVQLARCIDGGTMEHVKEAARDGGTFTAKFAVSDAPDGFIEMKGETKLKELTGVALTRMLTGDIHDNETVGAVEDTDAEADTPGKRKRVKS